MPLRAEQYVADLVGQRMTEHGRKGRRDASKSLLHSVDKDRDLDAVPGARQGEAARDTCEAPWRDSDQAQAELP